MAGRVDTSLKAVTFKTSRADPAGATIMFFTKVYTEFKRHGAQAAIDHSPKALVNRIIPKLQPPIVRDTIKREHPYWKVEKRYDLRYFQKKVIEVSQESAKYSRKRGRLEDDSDRQVNSGDKNQLRDVRNNKRHKRGDGGSSKSDKARTRARSNEGGKAHKTKENEKEWTTPYLNPKCDKIHPLKSCTATRDAEKDVLFRELRSSRKKMSSLRGLKLTEGRWKAMVEGKLEAVALGDIGGDWCAIPQRMVDQLKDSGVYVSTTALARPIELDVAIKMPRNIKIIASSKARLSIKLVLPCGPLRVRRVEFLIIDKDMYEIFLGRPLLKCMGFDLESHLEKVRNKFDDADIGAMMTENLDSEPLNGTALNRFANYTGLRYDSVDDDPIALPEAAGPGIGEDTREKLEEAFHCIIEEAKRNGMSTEGLATASKLLSDYKDLFRINMSSDPPANVEPLKVRLKQGHRPLRSTQRRYAPSLQRAFISAAIRNLEQVGAIFPNLKSRWASPALAVTKPGPDKFRYTVDLRAPKSVTEPIASAIHNLESLFQTIRGCTVFANIDLSHAYWQITLHPDSQECISIQTPLGVDTPGRVLQGGADAGNHFQACTAQVFQELSSSLLKWLDVFPVHANSESELLRYLEKFFSLCREYGLKIHAAKSHLFLKEARFCDSEGVRFDPRRLKTLLEMRPPEKANELQQFICAANWMRTSIPEYAKVVAPLHSLMEQCYTQCKKRTKRPVRSVSLTNLWGAVHGSSFMQIKDLLGQSLRLSHPKKGFVPCLFSDASDTHLSSVLTQVPDSQMDIPVESQDQEPLSFLSDCFSGASSNWSIVEREAFALVESMTRLEYLIAGKEVFLFTDHANLVYIFDPVGQNPGIARYTANKLMRLALKLGGYRYVIEHLARDRNVWADILTRWAVRPNVSSKRLRISRLLVAPMSPSLSEEYDWPCRDGLISTQGSANETYPSQFSKIYGLLQDEGGVVWIPTSNSESLRLRILVAAHTGIGGHRGITPSYDVIKRHFSWKSLKIDVEALCRSRLHCLLTAAGETIPRPLGISIHAELPNEVLHFDFCYIGRSSSGEVYILILKGRL